MQWLIATLLMFTLNAGAAEIKTPDLSFSNGIVGYMQWEKVPSLIEAAVLVARFEDINGEPATDIESLDVSVLMVSMGHGTMPPVIEPLLDESGVATPGAYRISEIYFFMIGDWQVRFKLKFKDGFTEAKDFLCQVENRH